MDFDNIAEIPAYMFSEDNKLDENLKYNLHQNLLLYVLREICNWILVFNYSYNYRGCLHILFNDFDFCYD